MRHLRRDYDPIQFGMSEAVRTCLRDLADALRDPDPTGRDPELLERTEVLLAVAPKIPEDEPVFVIRAKDPLAWDIVTLWADHQDAAGADAVLCDAVCEWGKEMERYRRRVYGPDERRHADVPEGALRSPTSGG